jgi:protein involved in polysaccharide export with SLBB domain
VGLAAFALTLVGCAITNRPPAHPPQPTNFAQPGPVNTPLQSLDKITVELTGIPVPIQPTTMDISEKGTITLAFIDHPIQAAGKSPQELEDLIRNELVPRIYTHVNVTVTPYQRYFYVGGRGVQTGNSGRVMYLGRITVIGAINAAGGFSDYAAKKRVVVTRLDGTSHTVNCIKAIDHPELDLEVFPGDKIYVPPRTFWEAW